MKIRTIALCFCTAAALACSSLLPGSEPTPTTEAPPTATHSPTSTLPSTPTEAVILPPTIEVPAPSAGGQDRLKEEWGPLLEASTISLFSCTAMYGTQARFMAGAIDAPQARSELDIVYYTLSVQVVVLSEWDSPSDRVVPYRGYLWSQMEALGRVWDQLYADGLGSSAVQQDLDETCASLDDTQTAIYGAAVEAGLTAASLSELEAEYAGVLDLLLPLAAGP